MNITTLVQDPSRVVTLQLIHQWMEDYHIHGDLMGVIRGDPVLHGDLLTTHHISWGRYQNRTLLWTLDPALFQLEHIECIHESPALPELEAHMTHCNQRKIFQLQAVLLASVLKQERMDDWVFATRRQDIEQVAQAFVGGPYYLFLKPEDFGWCLVLTEYFQAYETDYECYYAPPRLNNVP